MISTCLVAGCSLAGIFNFLYIYHNPLILHVSIIVFYVRQCKLVYFFFILSQAGVWGFITESKINLNKSSILNKYQKENERLSSKVLSIFCTILWQRNRPTITDFNFNHEVCDIKLRLGSFLQNPCFGEFSHHY